MKNKVKNPFLKSDNTLINPSLDYKSILGRDVSDKVKSFIEDATGLKRQFEETTEEISKMKASTSEKSLVMQDVLTELPKLGESQIKKIIGTHFKSSPVISESDAAGIFAAQNKTGMSALAILGIGALESGYGTSSIAKRKNNLWGWGAKNSSPSASAKTFSPVSAGAAEFAENYVSTYYNKYGAKSIYDAGTGRNPSNMGYAYTNSGNIDSTWADKVGQIMTNFYYTAGGTTSPRKSSGSKMADGAAKHLGVKYVWGGTDTSGFDCSGLVKYVAEKNGKRGHRTSSEQFKYDGEAVGRHELEPGDLVFFDTKGTNDGNVSHVGIYVGDGKMIHAPRSGDVVKYTSIESDYYKKAYVGAKRL